MEPLLPNPQGSLEGLDAKFCQGWRSMSSSGCLDENVLTPPAISADHDFSPINKTDDVTARDGLTGSDAKVSSVIAKFGA
jgi:hypothetical protein